METLGRELDPLEGLETLGRVLGCTDGLEILGRLLGCTDGLETLGRELGLELVIGARLTGAERCIDRPALALWPPPPPPPARDTPRASMIGIATKLKVDPIHKL
ncbi:hypothetical protein ACFPK9_10860 [Rubritalea spongiae]|uniref:Uncharacterized protein n=1 Tax=Rubritalea spongiae TaxID=430797 RepID=A0ABW5DYK9_9BACT